MFQYAFAYALARRTGAEVLLDPLYWGTSLRKYQLEEFSITNKNYLVSKAMDYLLGFGPRNGRKFKYQYRQYLIHKKYKVVEEKQAAHYDPDMEQQTVPSFYLGFWQTPNSFHKLAALVETLNRKTARNSKSVSTLIRYF